ncbi:hypothetical protein X474_22790 [Dethiosulfatarculus sandiegensis]|uniref:Uncharacterized protein n=1 Tax=Dethiosulfatarculus sandiegensis TaxID=1429043 RepID=A0A0D2J0J3_9BACT|nr:hypothetical protein X474_22790 [Dethiosulfatarculus sandiegensis]
MFFPFQTKRRQIFVSSAELFFALTVIKDYDLISPGCLMSPEKTLSGP